MQHHGRRARQHIDEAETEALCAVGSVQPAQVFQQKLEERLSRLPGAARQACLVRVSVRVRVRVSVSVRVGVSVSVRVRVRVRV